MFDIGGLVKLRQGLPAFGLIEPRLDVGVAHDITMQH